MAYGVEELVNAPNEVYLAEGVLTSSARLSLSLMYQRFFLNISKYAL